MSNRKGKPTRSKRDEDDDRAKRERFTPGAEGGRSTFFKPTLESYKQPLPMPKAVKPARGFRPPKVGNKSLTGKPAARQGPSGRPPAHRAGPGRKGHRRGPAHESDHQPDPAQEGDQPDPAEDGDQFGALIDDDSADAASDGETPRYPAPEDDDVDQAAEPRLDPAA